MGTQVKAGEGYISLSIKNPQGKVKVFEEDVLLVYDQDDGGLKVVNKDGEVVGTGKLVQNQMKRTPESPDFRGWIALGIERYEVIAWNRYSLHLKVFNQGRLNRGLDG